VASLTFSFSAQLIFRIVLERSRPVVTEATSRSHSGDAKAGPEIQRVRHAELTRSGLARRRRGPPRPPAINDY